ncbi:MAG: 2,3-dihydroxybenzoate-AMP ligase [Betaproteobacteria bacterium RIFCSPLOWO2_12_FULL_65_14]|nr:MAG: 2,3-dihydroxybenzoate-AMP ligase [Betaproteobacteria bacterium RIFCSPLOWO2_12_FULL_65_14]
MLQGCTPWPAEYARLYRQKGYWQDISIPDRLAASIVRRPGKTALVHGDERITYAELGSRIERLAAQFVRAELKPLDRVVLQLHNVPEFVYAYFGLIRAGAIPVMALRAHRHAEVRHFLSASGATAYVIPDVLRGFDYRAMAEEMRAACPALKQVFVAGEPLAGQVALGSLLEGSLTNAETQATLRRVKFDPSEVALMLLSGGTTSLSKLIPRTHNDYVYNALQCGRIGGLGEDSVLMPILPLGHNYNLSSPGLMGTLYHGGTVVLAPSADPETVFPLIERERVTIVPAAIPLVAAWLNSQVPERHDLSSLKVVQNGGARLAPELRARLRDKLRCTPQEIYGTAEGLINMVRLEADDEAILQSSGMPVCEDDEIKVLGDEGEELADGEPGELCVRGPYTIRGYYNAPDKNREAFTADGYYRMGDIVRKRGRHVYTEGRRKDIINRGGEKISCDEIENYIFAHPKVKAVTLVAMPDEAFGEKACAFVIPKPGETLALDELIAFLKAKRIASFKLPERLEIVSEFPTSPVGKILKRELRERIAAQLAEERKR